MTTSSEAGHVNFVQSKIPENIGFYGEEWPWDIESAPFEQYTTHRADKIHTSFEGFLFVEKRLSIYNDISNAPTELQRSRGVSKHLQINRLFNSLTNKTPKLRISGSSCDQWILFTNGW